MSIEKYFRHTQMEWFKEGSGSRFSPYNWSENKKQALRACDILYELSQGIHTPTTVGIIGFGFGRETQLLFEQGVSAKVVGLDINPSRFEEAKRIRPKLFNDQLDPVVASMNKTPFGDSAFDAVLCLETMMHADDPSRTLRELTRITKPDGVIIFNISTSLGAVNNLIKMLCTVGLSRMVGRLKERVLRDKDSSSHRTRLYTREQIGDLINNNSHTRLETREIYSRGLSTFIVLRKLVETDYVPSFQLER